MTREQAVNYLRSSGMNDDQIGEVAKAFENKAQGNWQEVYAETDYRNGWIEFTCENCEYQHGLESGEYGWSYGDPIPWKYCPMCGARMIEPQERNGMIRK